MKSKEDKLEKICAEVADLKSYSGGGSVMAISGALATSLIVKVAGFSLKDKAISQEVGQILVQARQLLTDFYKLAEADSVAFQAWSVDKENGVLVETLVKVPLATARNSLSLLKMASFLVERGNQNLLADSRVVLELATACFYGGLEIVRTNIKLIKNPEFESKLREEIDQLLDEAEKLIKP